MTSIVETVAVLTQKNALVNARWTKANPNPNVKFIALMEKEKERA
jgi:hypothetical protein